MANSLKKALKVSASYDASVIDGNKRRRESEVLDGSNIVSEKIKAIEDLRDMGIRQLREQAILRGLSSTGSKKELLYRLCAESEKESKNFKPEGKELEDEEEETSNKDEKVTTSGNKGTAVLDQYLPDHIRTQYHVLEHGDSIYDATLNQTNVGDNHNKFYLIQALEFYNGSVTLVSSLNGINCKPIAESNDSSKFMVYTRWGRVGIKGQDKLQGPYTSRGSAIQEFEAKFFSKTKNRWLNRKDFICHPKCYIWLETDYEMNKESPELLLFEKIYRSCTRYLLESKKTLRAYYLPFLGAVIALYIAKADSASAGFPVMYFVDISILLKFHAKREPMILYFCV
ncbi:unnamed protein product [Dovyalis caffra]|uniref:WGR domain-containing protein n=1 Tax=Dovyalis caffra TaxID=77055 RepID=A0AAV1SDH6_9ROSI|nr:unnamed protein product [Dovyalis caffra]